MNRLRYILSLINLLIYFLLHYFYGILFAAVSSFIFALIVFAYTYLVEKKIDKSIFADLAFLLLISLFIASNLSETIQDIIFELIIVSLLAIIFYLPQKYLKRILPKQIEHLDSFAMQNIYRLIQILLFLFSLHLVIVFIAINAGLTLDIMIHWSNFIIIFMLFLLINHNYYSLSAIIWKIFYKNDEIIPFIDSHSRILFYLPRKVAHKRPLYRHPTVHLLVINSKNELLLQKRSKSTRIFPLRWDSSVGGHVTKGESLESALKKEAYEEIALDNFKAEFLAQYEIIADNNLESVCLFITKHDGPFQANPNEVAELKFWSLEEIENTHRSHFTDHLIEEEIRHLKSYFMKKKINRK